MEDLHLVIPSPEELAFRQALLADEQTMAYNHSYGGTVDFAPERWADWYARWVQDESGAHFYRYVYSERRGCFVGSAAYFYLPELQGYVVDLLIHARWRGQGLGRAALRLLCAAAKANGLDCLWDDILADNPSIRLFEQEGFVRMGRTSDGVAEGILVKKVL